MNSTILRTATRILVPLFLVIALIILWRGHNAPGGGFIGGLMAVIAVALYALAEGVAGARRLLRIDALSLAGIGLAMSTLGGLWGAANGGAFLQGVWPFYGYVPGEGTQGWPVGSILLFDTGVFVTVLGAVCTVIFSLEDAVYAEQNEEQS